MRFDNRNSFFLKSSAFLKISIYEFTAIMLFFIIILNYSSPHFLIQAFALNVIALGIFILIPNLLYNKIFLALFTVLGFLVITLTTYRPPFLEIMSVFVYLSLAIFFTSISSYSLGKYMRLDYVNKQYLMEISTKDPLT